MDGAPDPAQASSFFTRATAPPRRTLRAAVAEQQQLLVGLVRAQFAVRAFDPLPDLARNPSISSGLAAADQASRRPYAPGHTGQRCDANPRRAPVAAGFTTQGGQSDASNNVLLDRLHGVPPGGRCAQHRQPHPRMGLNRGTRRARRIRVGQISGSPAGSYRGRVRLRAALWPSPAVTRVRCHPVASLACSAPVGATTSPVVRDDGTTTEKWDEDKKGR